MKNIKKLNRRDLEQVNGSGVSRCDGCPTHLVFGPGSPNDPSCEAYFGLSETCKMCVMVSVDCFVQISAI
jgi:hypothetical protein